MSDLISRQAAIDAIDKALSRTFIEPCGEMILKDLPSAQPEYTDAEGEPMDDLISRNALFREMEKAQWYNNADRDEIAEELVLNAPTIEERKWIPCRERLPEDDTEVFVYLFDRPSPFIAWIEDCHWYTEEFEVEKDNYPLAWMPLPEPYKGGEQDG